MCTNSRAHKLQTEMQIEMQNSRQEPEKRGHGLPAFGITQGMMVGDTCQVNGHWETQREPGIVAFWIKKMKISEPAR